MSRAIASCVQPWQRNSRGKLNLEEKISIGQEASLPRRIAHLACFAIPTVSFGAVSTRRKARLPEDREGDMYFSSRNQRRDW